ncbi:30S ribosomal protein S21, partial [Dysosmobacter welbionis]
DQQLEMLVLLAQLPQGGQVLLVMGWILQSNGEGIWVDLGKGVVDLSQMLRRDLVRGEALVG